ncbi:ABC transporter ATP-binding protein [Bacillus alkalicellulosilyticus]|uniref:ABC transporter ATP-binding protein n=1 Tax=Alkalihalobacterium alkalicellulosilyticum TaxID=1912214 RepID=UPI0009966622|nr:ABC transporter ATP-binding protein [Bacillus alkalicellulosilyticus]
MNDIIATQSLSLGYSQNLIIENLSINIPKGKITVFVGSNGCGKSTLLRSMARLLKPKTGDILLERTDMATIATKKLAKTLAILPQSPTAPEGLTVYQLVKQGRYPHQTWLKQWSKEDEKKVQDALEKTRLLDLKDQPVEELSGGQRQRAWIAMTLAQDTDIILLDEPTTYLDMTHQVEILDLLFELNERENRTIVMVLHDINLACRYAHHLVAMKCGEIFAQGPPEQVITPETVQAVFEMECQITHDPIFGTPLCIPYGRGRTIKQTALTGT